MNFFFPLISIVSALILFAFPGCKTIPHKVKVIPPKQIPDPKREALLDSARNSDHFIEVDTPANIMRGTCRRVFKVWTTGKAVLLQLEDQSAFMKKCDNGELMIIQSKVDSNYCFDRSSCEFITCPENKAKHK